MGNCPPSNLREHSIHGVSSVLPLFRKRRILCDRIMFLLFFCHLAQPLPSPVPHTSAILHKQCCFNHFSSFISRREAYVLDRSNRDGSLMIFLCLAIFHYVNRPFQYRGVFSFKKNLRWHSCFE